MARTNKEKEKEKEKVVEKPKEDSTAVVTVNIDDFTRTRDSVSLFSVFPDAYGDVNTGPHANSWRRPGAATQPRTNLTRLDYNYRSS